MPLRPNTFALTALLALLTAIGPLSTDMYLPSLPSIVSGFATTPAHAQLTLSVFLAGFAVGQIIYGPVADSLGRRPVLLVALAVYCLGAFLCAAAPSIDLLILGRFFQALGGAGPIVLARAMVRDLYSGPRAAQELATMSMLMGAVPAVAPVLGAVLEASLGWRSGFFASAAFGLALIGIILSALPETLANRSPVPSPLAMLKSFGIVLRHRGFQAYLALLCLSYAGLFCWISASSFILQGLYGLGPFGFAAWFIVVVAAFITGSTLAARLVRRLGASRTIGTGVMLLAIGGVSMVGALAIGFGNPAEVVLPMAIYLVGIGFIMPQAMAGALQPFPERAGAASSLAGFIQMSAAALVGIALGVLMGKSAWPLAGFVAAGGVLAAVVFFATRRVRHA